MITIPAVERELPAAHAVEGTMRFRLVVSLFALLGAGLLSGAGGARPAERPVSTRDVLKVSERVAVRAIVSAILSAMDVPPSCAELARRRGGYRSQRVPFGTLTVGDELGRADYRYGLTAPPPTWTSRSSKYGRTVETWGER